MHRALGAVLILLAGVLTRRLLLEELRQVRRTRQDLAAAFEAMEAEIRLLLTPVPALLRRDYGKTVDGFFSAASRGVSRGETLVSAWKEAAGALSLPEEERLSAAALGSRLDGDESSACAALRLAAEELRRKNADEMLRECQNEKNISVISITISLLLIVLLL